MNTPFKYILDKPGVEKLLPQKAPFVMIDTLLAFSDGAITSGLTILEDNILTEDNRFTEPGIIEHMAQTMALHSGYKLKDVADEPQTGYIGAIKKVEISKLPKVGDRIETTATIQTEFLGITLVTMVCKCEDNLIAKAEMKTVLVS